MDDFEFPSADNVQAESSHNASRGSGLRLVIPSLKTLQALKNKKKGKHAVFLDTPVQKIPRPLKLKPLKEVLTKLLAQVKKKDDYAFFLQPVDTSKVTGYEDVVKQPMDLGTMTTKADLRLVTGNAKLFNPAGTIFYTEAERIEAYALQHIAKAAATVIEVETDWNVDVENDGEPTANVDDDAEDGREKSTVADGSVRARSPSVASTGTPMAGPVRARQTKGKKKAGMLSETLEDDGHLPGYKDGVGVFPPGSDFAEVMLSLKLKGKRYRTKKERMRMERGGPPYHVDGSIDYPEIDQLVQDSRNKSTAVDYSSADRLLQAIRGSVDRNLPDYDLTVQPNTTESEEAYWRAKVAPAEDYVRDVVYGGVEGLAYVRSLATFIHHDDRDPQIPYEEPPEGLGMPLSRWVIENVVDPLTDGRHRLLRETAAHLQSPHPQPTSVTHLIDRSVRLLPQAMKDLATLRGMSGQHLDMAALIKKPEELFIADDVWAGAAYMDAQRQRLEDEQEKALVESPDKNAADYLAFAIQSHQEAEATKPKPTFEGPDVLLHALNWSADVIQELANKPKAKDDDAMDVDGEEKPEEDPYLRRLRLNLLALSKRAPLDKVARLPVELVPMHIRHVIPTLESAPSAS
ncbi:hypothetical protein EUX98_g8760 [Antrodiella citrinella]|uniref:Bromo domain-containing protein n=1 Tax=Antrodiella citrinella TaxID=2447956 RepID=A0A4S4M378_9APHY|nr:hypothetical protein EUX98_g8760 [Antrodiella citrinella]